MPRRLPYRNTEAKPSEPFFRLRCVNALWSSFSVFTNVSSLTSLGSLLMAHGAGAGAG